MNTADNISMQLGRATITMTTNDVMEVMAAEILQHPDDQAVNNFAKAMRLKMALARMKGRHGWHDPAQCSTEHLNELLITEVKKGDPVDLANFAMMLWNRGSKINIPDNKNSWLDCHRLMDELSLFKSELLDREKSPTPRIGELWQEQGGIYAGIMPGNKGQADYYLIISPKEIGEFTDVPWGCIGKEISNASSETDGIANTQAMLDNGSELAKKMLDLEIDGHKDWYLPARKEARLCYIGGQDQFNHAAWYWTSTQCSADYAFFQVFDDGYQLSTRKGHQCRARAVRRLSVIQ